MDLFYRALATLGYTHPIHPPLTHVVVGCLVGAFVFALMARITGKFAFETSARHSAALAAAAVPPTILLGILDWQHRYGGAWLAPVKTKMVLAGVLLVLLLAGVLAGRRVAFRARFVVYACSLLVAVGLGYFGGELVYGGKTTGSGPVSGEISQTPEQAGEEIYAANCAGCHFAESTESKYGPGLQGILKRPTLPSSGRPATEENIRHQLTAPLRQMPAFPHLSEADTAALMAYLGTL